MEKWQTDEIIAYYVDKGLRILLWPIQKILSLHYASIFNTPINRRLQTLSISVLIFLFLVGAQTTMILLGLVFFWSEKWVYLMIYFTHYFLDADKPEQGSRPIGWFRNAKFWKFSRDYFPIMMVKDKKCNLKPTENYLMGFHPHGVLSLSAISTFAMNEDDFQDIFPGMSTTMCTLPVWLRVPFFREILMAVGFIPATPKCIKYMLQRSDGGNCVALVVGGAPESLYSRPGRKIRLFLKRRFGFIKLALQTGASVVPVFSFGEHLLFDQDENPEGSFMKKFQDNVQKWTGGITFPSFHGRGILQYDIGMLPYRKQVYVVLGEPINFGKIENPNYDEIGAAHAKYMENLQDLFERYKHLYLDSETVLEIC